MGGILAGTYGVISYLIFFVTFLYAIGFVGNLIVPKAIDSGSGASFLPALIINLLLLGVFAVQHSVMARPGFKRWWTRLIPAPVERSTYVLASSLALILLFWLWQPMPGIIWDVDNAAGSLVLWTLFWAGWIIVLLSTFMINHFELFGLEQVYRHIQGKPMRNIEFMTPWLYRFVRHPIMLGFIIAFWATPTMSEGHLLFAATTTVYILIALQLEEKDLIRHHGDDYRDYRQRTPILVPWKGLGRGKN